MIQNCKYYKKSSCFALPKLSKSEYQVRLRILPTVLFPVQQSPQMALFMVDICLFMRSHDFVIYHKTEVQWQAKNRWLQDSSSSRQKTQLGSVCRNRSLSRVRSFPIKANHRIKLYPGIDQGSQTTFAEETGVPLSRRKS